MQAPGQAEQTRRSGVDQRRAAGGAKGFTDAAQQANGRTPEQNGDKPDEGRA